MSVVETAVAQVAGAAARGGPGAPEAQVLAYVAPRLRPALERLLPHGPAWLEIRLRLGQPLCVVTAAIDLWVGAAGAGAPADALVCGAEDIERTLQLVTRASVYAWEGELAQGFCTLPGGHRAGLCGRALTRGGRVVGQKLFGSVNLRIARQVPGAADALVALLAAGGARTAVPSLLLYGPPGSGKTTLLRDLCRQLSTGRPDRGVAPRRVAIVDERSEIGACADGRPQFDLGPRCDVLDGAPKARGLGLLVRAMGPEVVACDEIGGAGDARALTDASRCGVAVLATAHAGSAADLQARPALRAAVRSGAFDFAVALGVDRAIGAVIPLADRRPPPCGMARLPVAGPRRLPRGERPWAPR